MDPWIWASLLLMLGLGLALLEIFFPSAGILGFLSACATLGAVIMGFQHGSALGLAVLVVAVVGLPAVVVLGLNWWPKTTIGRKVLLMAPTSEDVLPEDPLHERLKGLVGQVGRTRCKMLPSGAITIAGGTVDAVSEGMPIEEGQPVRVIEVRANRVVVRPLEEETPTESAEDPLQRPIDSVAPDPFEEPPS